MNREQRQNAIEAAQKIIIDFVRDNYGEEKVAYVIELFKSCKIVVDDEEIAKFNYTDNVTGCRKTSAAFVKDGTMYIPSEMATFSPTDEWGTESKLCTLIHEYGHLLRGKDKNAAMFEEGFVTVFAEACMISAKLKYHQKDNKDAKKEAVYNSTSWEYKKSESQIRAILYILNQEGKDISAMGRFILGNREEFKKECISVFGEGFAKYYDVVTNWDTDAYYNSYDEKENNSEEILVNLIKDYIIRKGLNIKDYWDNNKLIWKNEGSPTLEAAIVLAGKEYFKDSPKEYELFEKLAQDHEKDAQSYKDHDFKTIRDSLNKLIDISSKDADELFSKICSICEVYIQRKNCVGKENKLYIEELRKEIPDIEEIASLVKKLLIASHAKNFLIGVDPTSVSLNNLKSILENILAKKEQEDSLSKLEEIKASFSMCHNIEDIVKIITRIKEANIEQSFPNFSEFIKYINAGVFRKDEMISVLNYEDLLGLTREKYIIIKENELQQAKDEDEKYQSMLSDYVKAKTVLKYQDRFPHFKEKQDMLETDMDENKEKQEQLNESKKASTHTLESLKKKTIELQSLGLVHKILKRKQIRKIKSQVTVIEKQIASYDEALQSIGENISNISAEVQINNQELRVLSGLDVKTFGEILDKCLSKGITIEKIDELIQEIENKRHKLNIAERERELQELYLISGKDMDKDVVKGVS